MMDGNESLENDITPTSKVDFIVFLRGDVIMCIPLPLLYLTIVEDGIIYLSSV